MSKPELRVGDRIWWRVVERNGSKTFISRMNGCILQSDGFTARVRRDDDRIEMIPVSMLQKVVDV